jgi:hypothetical protein
MRKLAIFTMVALLAPLAILATSGVAKASITTSCLSGYDECGVQEDMGNGMCNAMVFQTDSDQAEDPSGTFAAAWISNYDTGYTCDGWIERNVNNSGWYQLSGTFAIPSSGPTDVTDNYFDGGGYQARVCIQFNWGSSLGAVHCSSPITYIG